MPETSEIEIHGTSTEQTTGPHGEEGCERTLHVSIGGEEVYVPWEQVRGHAYDHYGIEADQFDVDRLILYNGHLHAEADVDEGIIEVIPDYNMSTAEFKGYDRWEMKLFDADSESDGTVIHERDD